MAKEQDTQCGFFPSQELTKFCTKYCFSYMAFILLLLCNRVKDTEKEVFKKTSELHHKTFETIVYMYVYKVHIWSQNSKSVHINAHKNGPHIAY